jgi:hypothetical protein
MYIRRYGRFVAGRNKEQNLQKEEESESKIMGGKNTHTRRGETFLMRETRIRDDV